MGAEIPKQYLKLLDKTVIEHTLGRLAGHQGIAGIVIAVAEHDSQWSGINHDYDVPIHTVIGGRERHHSVLNGLRALSDFCEPNDWVLVHDAARPCVRREDIDKLITTLIDHPVGGILGVPVADTMKRVDNDNIIAATVNRAGLWHAQTPQMFRLGQLIDAIKDAMDIKMPITDEASAMEIKGFSPMLVEGHKDNIKITGHQDLLLAELYMQQQQRERQ